MTTVRTRFACGINPFPTANNPFPNPTIMTKNTPAKATKAPQDEDYSTNYVPPMPPTQPAQPSPMETLRQSLLDTLKDLRNRDNPMDIERAKAVATVATVLVDTAKVENDYLRITGHDRSQFIGNQALLTQ